MSRVPIPGGGFDLKVAPQQFRSLDHVYQPRRARGLRSTAGIQPRCVEADAVVNQGH